ncbi:MAG: mandelate racemase [Pseudomonadota bacterium]|nr:mandelate racemase [Pseudomonadota bacterium]
MQAPTFHIDEIRFLERPVELRLPFRFGAVTVTHAPQAFVRVRIRLADGRASWGAGAELMVPKWFDKSPELSEAQSFDQLRESLLIARDSYTADAQARTAFGHFAAHHQEIVEACCVHSLPPLVAAFGAAQIDKAVLDALGHALDLSFFELVRRNVAAIAPETLLPEFGGFDFSAFAASLRPSPSLAVRHTVGMLDSITGQAPTGGDGLPVSLAEAIDAYGLHYFKIKLGGEIDHDLARLTEIASLLDARLPEYVVTLDGNEQYDALDALSLLWQRLESTAPLAHLCRRIAFIEQPVNRLQALEHDVTDMARQIPIIIDESDASFDAFPRARDLGYRGVSSKACKGLYKSLINRARCERWNAQGQQPPCFMTGEDLTTQAGLAVQQDLALASLLGVVHVERNGHHYVNGFAGQHAPPVEQQGFLAAHPALYELTHGSVRLRLRNGTLALGSLAGSGFASAAQPEWSGMSSLRAPASKTLQRIPHAGSH